MSGERQPSGARGGALLLGIMFLGYAVYAADRTVLSSMLKPLQTALQLSNTQVGLLTSAQYIGVLAVVFAAGTLSDRFGTRRVILWGVSVFTAFTWLIGLSANFYEAFAFRLVSGVGEGMFWPAAMSAVAKYFGMKKGRALGVFYVGFDVGSAAGSSIGGVTYGLTSDWRYAFFVAPVLGIAVIAGTFLAKSTFQAADGKVGSVALGRDALGLVRRRDVLLLMAFALAATWASIWEVTYLSYYFSSVYALSVPLAAFVMSPVAISGGFGKVLIGNASDKWNRGRVLAAASASVVLLYAMFFSESNVYLAALVVLAIGFASSAIFPVMQSLMCDVCGGGAGTALGLTTTAQSVATVVAPITTASLFSLLGVGGATAINAVVPAVLMLCIALLLRDPRSGESGPKGSPVGLIHP